MNRLVIYCLVLACALPVLGTSQPVARLTRIENPDSSYPLKHYKYTVQIGSFLEYRNAMKLVEKVSRESDVMVKIEKVLVNGRWYHRVLVGRFPSKWDAEDWIYGGFSPRGVESNYLIKRIKDE